LPLPPTAEEVDAEEVDAFAAALIDAAAFARQQYATSSILLLLLLAVAVAAAAAVIVVVDIVREYGYCLYRRVSRETRAAAGAKRERGRRKTSSRGAAGGGRRQAAAAAARRERRRSGPKIKKKEENARHRARPGRAKEKYRRYTYVRIYNTIYIVGANSQPPRSRRGQYQATRARGRATTVVTVLQLY